MARNAGAEWPRALSPAHLHIRRGGATRPAQPNRSPGVPTARVLDDELNRTAKDAALRVDGVNRHLTADELVFPQRREGTGQRIVEADLDGVCCARGSDEW